MKQGHLCNQTVVLPVRTRASWGLAACSGASMEAPSLLPSWGMPEEPKDMPEEPLGSLWEPQVILWGVGHLWGTSGEPPQNV